jgi:hypothetical protein
MSTVDITQGLQDDNIQLNITVLPYIKMKLNSILVIINLIKGTDGDEWLIEAEENG